MIWRARARRSRSRRGRSVVHRLELVEVGPDEAGFEAECGKGAYVRAIARDLGRALGCHGHIAALRRTRVGPFLGDERRGARRSAPIVRGAARRPCCRSKPAWRNLPRVAVDRHGAAVLRRGQRLLLRGADAPGEGPAWAACFGAPIALGCVEGGCFVPTRVFNLPG